MQDYRCKDKCVGVATISSAAVGRRGRGGMTQTASKIVANNFLGW